MIISRFFRTADVNYVYVYDTKYTVTIGRNTYPTFKKEGKYCYWHPYKKHLFSNHNTGCILEDNKWLHMSSLRTSGLFFFYI